MTTERTPNRRLLVLIAISIVLLVSAGWFLAERVPQASGDGDLPNTGAVAFLGTGDSPKTSASYRSRVRAVQGKDLIRNKVKSLVNIRSGEIGIISIPEAALNQHFGPAMDSSIADIPLLRNIVTKKSLISNLEGVLNAEGEVKVRVIDQNNTECSGKDFQLEIELVGQNTEVSTVRIQLTSNGAQSKTTLSVYPGYSLVFRLPPPAEVGVVIMIGDGSSPATANTKQ